VLIKNKIQYSKTYSINILQVIFFLFILLLPIKFGTPAALPEISTYPSDFMSWLVYSWSPPLFTLFSSCILLLTLILLYKKNHLINSNSSNFIIPFLWFLLVISSLLGGLKSSCADFTYLECLHLLGLSLFTFAIFRFLEIRSAKNFTFITVAITIGTIFISMYGIYQYLSGFTSTRNIVMEVIQSKDIILPPNFYSRLMDNLVYSTFSISNSLAAHLILTIPLCIYVVSKIYTSKYLRYIVTSIITIILIICLILTGSRAAILSLVLSIAIMFIVFTKSIKYKVLFILICLVFVSFYFYFFSSKGYLSILIRLDYFKTSFNLLINNWLTGAGWGSFFHVYPSTKSLLTGEAPHMPHNILLSMGSQAGIITMLIALIILVLPIFYGIRNISVSDNRIMDYSLLTGYLAWVIHSLMDINIQIPGTVAMAITMTALIIYRKKEEQKHYLNNNKYFKNYWSLLMLIICIAGLYFSVTRINGEIALQKLENTCDPVYKILTVKDFHYIPPKKSTVKKLLLHSSSLLPYSPFPWASAGNYALANKHWEFAEKCYKKAILLSPDRANFYFRLAMAQYYLDKKNLAYENLEIAAKLFPYKYKKILSNFK